MDLTWWQLLIIVVAAITTLRIAANFDVAAILENRRRHRHESLKALCPHAIWETDGDQICLWKVRLGRYRRSACSVASCFHHTILRWKR
jgi:hypothetical protein